MKVVFKPTPISELLKPITRKISVDPLKEYPLLGIRLDGGGVFLRERKLGSQIAAPALFQVKSGDFIYSRLFAWRGAFGVINDDLDGCYVSSEFPTFIPIHDKIDSKFLQYWFRLPTTISKVEADCTGSTPLTRNRFKENFFLALETSLPSLEEQCHIIARIEELAVRIEEARGLRREAAEERKQLLASAITRILKTIASEAKEVTVESIAHSVTDGDHQPPPKADSGIPFIFINHVVGGNIDFSGCKWVPPEYFASLSANRIPKPGDVLYTAVGSYGVPCLVNVDEPFCFQRHIAIIKPDQNRIVPAYLKWALSSSDVFDQATKVATGSAQLTVPLRGIRNLQFPLPSLYEQHRIVTYLDDLRSKVDSLKQLQSETSAELDALLPSILDKAFKGKL